jgi:hypothetical protein
MVEASFNLGKLTEAPAFKDCVVKMAAVHRLEEGLALRPLRRTPDRGRVRHCHSRDAYL